MQARIKNPALRFRAPSRRSQQLGRLGDDRRDPRDHPLPGASAREPDQRLQRVRGHPLPRARARRREQRANPHGRGVARDALLQRRRARGAGAHRGRHPPRRPARSGAGRGLGRGGAPLHRRRSSLRSWSRSRRSTPSTALNAATRQITGGWVAQIVERSRAGGVTRGSAMMEAFVTAGETRGSGRWRHDRSRATARRAAAGRLRDRLPHARQRLRGRGRGAGGAAARASDARVRRGDRDRRARSSPR